VARGGQRQSGARRGTQQRRRTRAADNEGIIPVLARTVREVENAVGRGSVMPSVRSKFQVVALLAREERTRVKGDPDLTESRRGEQLKRLDGIATILATTAARDSTLFTLLDEDAEISESAKVLMREIQQLHGVLNPVETLFVVDAMQGQDAVNTAKAFKEALPLTGIILTKLDGDSRGGAALSVRQITGAPIKFAGVSEKIDGLEVFDAERHAGRILGMGDILALVEQVTAGVDMAQAQKLAAKVKSGEGFDLNDFLDQIRQMKQMGGLSSLMDKLPSGMAAKATEADMDRAERDIKRKEGIICSMTLKERTKPEIIKATRKRRIAAGAGVQVQEVNRLLKEFEQMQGMMKKMKGGGMMKMLKRMGGMKGMPKLPGMG
jgi:signal recognition particle GTPase